jgi:hypothetical protein
MFRKVLRRLQSASGIYGMVAAPEKTSLLHSVVGRFTTGHTIRVVRPAEVQNVQPWIVRDNKSCGLRLVYDLPRGKCNGYLTVRVCWCSIVFVDECDFALTHFVY